MIGDENGNGDIIKEMREEGEERERSTRGSKGGPDHLTINSVVGRLDIQECNDWMVAML